MSTLSSYRRSRSESPTDKDAEPSVRGYQLIGDSQFLRFSEQLLKKPRKQQNGLAYLGLCVSGQKIGDLLKRVRDNFAGRLSDRAVLMIGTNDLLQGTSYENMRASLDSLLEQLRVKGVQKIIMLTVPPVPRLEKDASHWTRLGKYNEHILRRHNGRNVIVINAYARFVEPRKSSMVRRPPSLERRSLDRRSTSSEKRTTSDRSSTSSTPLLNSRRSTSSIFASTQNGDGGTDSSDSESSTIANLKYNQIRVSIDDDEPGRRQVYVLTPESADGRRHQRFNDSSPSSLMPSRYAKGGDGGTALRALERRKRAHSSAEGSDDEYSNGTAAKRRAYSTSVVEVCSVRSSTPKKRAHSLTMSDGDDDDNYMTPFSKRRRQSHSTSVADDDHNDRHASSNLNTQEQRIVANADTVLMEYFEEFFAGHRRRPDRIHFNNAGLRVIQRLILDAINHDG